MKNRLLSERSPIIRIKSRYADLPDDVNWTATGADKWVRASAYNKRSDDREMSSVWLNEMTIIALRERCRWLPFCNAGIFL